MTEEKQIESIVLITVDGGNISLDYTDDIAEQIFDEIQQTLQTGESWNVGNWTDAKATFKGYILDNINMRLIVGWR